MLTHTLKSNIALAAAARYMGILDLARQGTRGQQNYLDNTHTQGQFVEKCCWHLFRRLVFDSPGSLSSEAEHCYDLLYITGACILCLEIEKGSRFWYLAKKVVCQWKRFVVLKKLYSLSKSRHMLFCRTPWVTYILKYL